MSKYRGHSGSRLLSVTFTHILDSHLEVHRSMDITYAVCDYVGQIHNGILCVMQYVLN